MKGLLRLSDRVMPLGIEPETSPKAWPVQKLPPKTCGMAGRRDLGVSLFSRGMEDYIRYRPDIDIDFGR